ncbi:uncharacterized protein LOC117292329 [Asterias rubens]|uniref:uncharacterized protein LOC117292329 n=1 Tax=Asterias rubens TaxID=7604 RepID=UPI0014555E8F|nr:uncharacterized protein LOC117292329 [Asterias rubens]
MTERVIDAVLSLRYQQLDALLRKNVSVNTRNRLGQTPLMVSCYISNEEKSYRMFKHLLRKGADILETDDKRTSVFQHACKQGREKIAKCIIRKMSVVAVDLGGKNLEGRTPLFDAVTSGNESLVRFIVRLMRKRSLTVDTPDHSGVTPLIHAYKMGLVVIAQVLEKDGKANPRICDTERHMNSHEWAEEAAQKRLRALALHKERTKEQRMIYPHFDHRKPPFSSHKSSSLPEIKPQWEWASINTKPDIIGGCTWNDDSQRIADRNYNSSIVEESLQMSSGNKDPNSLSKSLDSAMTLLELTSKTSNKIHFAKNFVSSHFDKSKIGEYGNLTDVNSLLTIYSSQCGSAFRQPAKPPPEPKPVLEKPTLYEKKASTLAYIMGHGPRRVKDRRHYKRSRKRSVKSTGLHQKNRKGSASSSSDSVTGKLSVSRVSNLKVNDGTHNKRSQNGKVITKVDQDRANLGKLKRQSKSVNDSQKLSVPENEHRYHKSVAPSLKRDLLPNIRVTAPSA